MAPEIPTAMYIFGATVWPELPTWRSIGSQPASQMGREAASSAPSASASLLHDRDVLGFFDAAAYRDDDVGRREIHRALRFAEKFERLGADIGRRKLRLEILHRGRARLHLVGAPCARLQGSEPGRGAAQPDVHVDLALEELTHEYQFAAIDAVRDHVAHQHTIERRRQFGREVAHLVGVREQHHIRFGLRDELLQRGGIAVRRVVFQQIVVDGVDFLQLLRRQFRRQCADPLPDDGRGYRLVQLACELLGGGQRLERHAIPGAAALFQDSQDAHRTRASNFSFSTSLAAASFGSPSKSCVCLVRPGR